MSNLPIGIKETKIFTLVSGDYTASSWETLLIPTSPFDEWKITLPASPSVGDHIWLIDRDGSLPINPVRILPNGKKMRGDTTDRFFNRPRHGVVELVYSGETYGWLYEEGALIRYAGLVGSGTSNVHCGLVEDNGTKYWAWGQNTYGQLGNNTRTSYSSPQSMFTKAASFVRLVYGQYFTISLMSDGVTWSWGDNTGGQLGNNTRTSRSSPGTLVGTNSYIELAAGNNFAGGIRKEDGTAWAWGNNAGGQLGAGNVSSFSTAVSMSGGRSFKRITQGASHTALLMADGSAWCVGVNTYGQLGDSTTASKSSMVSVVGGHSFIAICAGLTHTLGLKMDGTIWGWGLNTGGQLGDGTLVNKSSPVPTRQMVRFKKMVANSHTLALDFDGNIWGWGLNESGQLGDGTTISKTSPVLVGRGHSFVDIDCGSSTSFGLKEDGTLWAWGLNTSVQLGINDYPYRTTPVSLYVMPGVSFQGLCHPSYYLNPGAYDYSSVPGFGYPWSWGDNQNGMIIEYVSANSMYCNLSVPIQAAVMKTSMLSLGTHGMIVDDGGTGYTWGLNSYGQGCGDDSTFGGINPFYGNPLMAGWLMLVANVGGLSTHGITTDYFVYGWGRNQYGEIGDSTTASKLGPVQAFDSLSASYIAAGYGSTAIIELDTGRLWAWGLNTAGQLGDNTRTNKSAPASVSITSAFKQVGVGNLFMAALCSANGVIYTWGQGTNGKLGHNQTTSRSVPGIVSGGRSFVAMAVGQQHCIAIQGSDGRLWAWGLNSTGQLGDGTLKARSSPVSVNCTHSFISVAAGFDSSMGLKADGTIWMWGNNNLGQLGICRMGLTLSPIQVSKV